MQPRFPTVLFLLFMPVFLGGCLAPKTPQDVAAAFWQAVITGDAQGAVRYSTLTTVESFDGFSKDWQGYQPVWGRVVIENDQASVAVEFTNPDASGDNSRTVVTYLLRRDDRWVVDYARTAQSVRGGAFGQFLGRLETMQDELAMQFDESSREFRAEMERLNAEAEALADSVGRKAEQPLEEYARALEETIRSLEQSIERALKEKQGELSDHDRRVLLEVSGDLERSRESLAEPDIAVIVESGTTVTVSRARLETTDGSVVGRYQEEWRDWTERFRQQMDAMLQELSASRT